MMNLSDPAAGRSSAAQTLTPADAEPDVTWGDGGIDDWGWMIVSQSDNDPPTPAPESA